MDEIGLDRVQGLGLGSPPVRPWVMGPARITVGINTWMTVTVKPIITVGREAEARVRVRVKVNRSVFVLGLRVACRACARWSPTWWHRT